MLIATVLLKFRSCQPKPSAILTPRAQAREPCASGSFELLTTDRPPLNLSLHLVLTSHSLQNGGELSSGQAEGTRPPVLEAGTGPAAAAVAWFLENLRADTKLSHSLNRTSKKMSDTEKRDLLGVAMLGRRVGRGPMTPSLSLEC